MDVNELLLTTAELRDITGAGLELTAIPGMDSSRTVDDEHLMDITPVECQFLHRESVIFGSDLNQFRKTTFQSPPKSALLSEAVAAYDDTQKARSAFDNLVDGVTSCDKAVLAAMFVGEWVLAEGNLHLRTGGDCGRIYRVASTVLIEVTYCGYSEVVPNLVVNRIASRVSAG